MSPRFIELPTFAYEYRDNGARDIVESVVSFNVEHIVSIKPHLDGAAIRMIDFTELCISLPYRSVTDAVLTTAAGGGRLLEDPSPALR